MKIFGLLEFIFLKKHKPIYLLWIGVFALVFHIILQLYPLSTLLALQITNIIVSLVCILSFCYIVFLLSRKPTRAQWFFIFILSIYALWGITCLMPALLGYRHVITKTIANPYYRILDGLLSMLFMLYPIEILRSRYLKFSTVLKILAPLFILPLLSILSNHLKSEGQEVIFKLIFILRMLLVIAYPLITLMYLLKYQKTYKQWCEQNYSNLEKLDTSWLKYYLAAYIVVCSSYLYAMLNPCREAILVHHSIFLLFFLLIFPFVLHQEEPIRYSEEEEEEEDIQFIAAYDNLYEQNIEERPTYSNSRLIYKEKLIHWMEQDKPYLKIDFRLIDIMNLLPLNRKYISRLINEEIGETFFYFVMKYRIEESISLMKNRPDLTIAKIATKSGFSSPSVFGRSFLKEKGISPLEYRKQYMFTNK